MGIVNVKRAGVAPALSPLGHDSAGASFFEPFIYNRSDTEGPRDRVYPIRSLAGFPVLATKT